ncbi:MAG: PAS domain S-box-containing protein [Oleispira sp.]|jgi:PAS domain S-box-containing protein
MIPIVNFGRLHWAVIALSIVLTIAAWQISNSQIEQKIQQRFDFLSSQLLSQITDRMNRYEDALRTGVVAIHTQSGNIDVEVWKRFSKALKLTSMYPGINGIGVIYHVPPEKLGRFLEKERSLRPGFEIHPPHNRGDYWPITYVEPLADNDKAVGLDMAFEDNRFHAAIKARDTAKTHITGPIVLVQDAKKTPGFLQFVPFYDSDDIATEEQRKKHFVGHVYAPFIMQKLIDGTLSQNTLKQNNRHLMFSIYDGEEQLYDELNSNNSDYNSQPLYSKKITLNMYNRSWDFTIQTATSFSDEVSSNQSTYILIGGIIIDSLLILLFIVLTGRNKNSLILVDEMTKKVIAGEEYFRHIIEAAPCGMIITNDQGIIEEVNPQAETLFGYSKQDLLGQTIDILVPHRFHDVHSEHRKDFYQHQENRRMGVDRNVCGLRRNGEEFPAEIGLAHFDGEGGSKILATVINMTEYVGITDELKRSNKDLNDFAYVASHDLKAPLRGIMQLASWIEEDVEDNASEETKSHLALLQSRTARLEKLLDDLLTYSRIGNHLGDIEQTDVRELVQTLFQLLDPPPEFELKLDDQLPIFNTLSTPLEVIFRNLIGNAIKHHDRPNGIISISAIECDSYYQFSIANDGPGIDPKHHEQIFEMFKTLRPRDEVEGSGMGLSIIKKMLDYHGQKISVSSSGERGVSFSFSWPKHITSKG